MTFQEVDESYLTDESYTISYSLVGNSWDSFHEYIPDKCFHTRDNLFSIKQGKVYKHRANNKCIYYDGVPKNSIISPTFVIGKHIMFENVYIIASVLNSENIRINKAFKRILVYNSYQSTGWTDIVVYDESKSFKDNYDEINTRRVKEGYFINKLRDNKANEYLSQVNEKLNGYLFNNLNLTNIRDGVKRLNDNYFIVLLEIDNSQQEDFYFYNISLNHKFEDR